MNVVMSSEGEFVEVQGTGEHGTFDRGELDALLDLAVKGLRELDAAQQRALDELNRRRLLARHAQRGKTSRARSAVRGARYRRD